MASKAKFSFVGLGFLFCSLVAFVLLLCLVAMQEKNPDCVTGYGCYHGEMENKNRKLLTVKEVMKGGLINEASSIEKRQNKEGSDLRMVPSGPDPLHHNANPKKPRTP